MIKKQKLWLDWINKNKTKQQKNRGLSVLAWFYCVQINSVWQMWYDNAPQVSWLPEIDESDSGIHYPYLQCLLPASKQERHFDVATSGSMKIELNQKPLPDFWIILCINYPAVANCAVKTLMPFATTHLQYVRVGSWFWQARNKIQAQWVCGKQFKTQTFSNSAKRGRVMCVLSSTPFSLTCGDYFTVSSTFYI